MYTLKDGSQVEKIPEDYTGLTVTNLNREHYLRGMQHHSIEPAVAWFDGDRGWILYDEYHRTTGPAIDYRYYKWWYIQGTKLFLETKVVLVSLIP